MRRIREASNTSAILDEGQSVAGRNRVDGDDMPTISGITLLHLLGRGGFASVYAGRADGSIAGCDAGTRLAIKVGRVGTEARLRREVQALRVVGSSVAPACFDTGWTEGGAPFIAMEYVGARSLSRCIDHALEPSDSAAFDVATSSHANRISWICSMCESVARIHAAGIVHRDIKPDHIFFRDDGSVVIIDYGLALPVELQSDLTMMELTRTGERVGTYHYMAPEQCLGHRAVSAATDIYALGIIAFQLLTGRPPFEGRDPATICQKHVLQRCPRPSRFADVAPMFDEIIARALAKEPSMRFQSANALALALRRAHDEGERSRGVAPSDSRSLALAPRPVALAWLRLAIELPRLDALAKAHDAVIVAIDGRDVVLAFPSFARARAGVHAALEIADAIEAEVGVMDRCVIHVAPIKVRRLRRGFHVSGLAVREPGEWQPPAETTGTWLSPAAARYVDSYRAHTEVNDGSDFVQLAAADRDIELPAFEPALVPFIGRDALMERVLASMSAAREDKRPILATIVSEVGFGKTRILHQLGIELRRRGDADVVYLRCERDAHMEDMARQLARVALLLDGHSVSPPALADAWSGVGVKVDTVGRLAIGLLLGTIDEQGPLGRRILDIPDALRLAAAPAIAHTLLERARIRPLYVLMDDVHWADQLTLDAIELATMRDSLMSDTPVELGIVVTAQPTLLSARDNWSERCNSVPPMALEPLEPVYARKLLIELLRPIEYVPDAILERICRIAGGVPLFLVELARTIRGGHSHSRRGREEASRIVTEEMPHTVDVRFAERLARHTLNTIPANLVPMVQLCAIWGDELTIADITALQDILEERTRRGPSSTPVNGSFAGHVDVGLFDIDGAAGLARLEARGIILPFGGGYRLRHPMLAQAIETLTPTIRRREYHGAAFEYRQRMPGQDTSRRLAHHAEQSGASEIAGTMYLDLADRASLRHHYVQARELYTQALDVLPLTSTLRGHALAGRGSASYRLQRLPESLADLRASRALAEGRGDEGECARLLLEESTVCDFTHDRKESARLALRAAHEVRRLRLDDLIPDVELALGRTHFNAQRVDQAIEHLQAAVMGALERGQERVRIMALPLLATALGYAKRFDEAECRFTELMDLCKEVGDDFHLAIAYNNRVILCIQLDDVTRAMDDLERCIVLAHRLGNAQLERAATVNLAELLYWNGALDRAKELAERARDLHLRYMSRFPTHDDHLLLARILCRQGDPAACEPLAWILATCNTDELPASASILLRMTLLAVAALSGEHFEEDEWQKLADEASRHTLLDEAIEVLVLAAQCCDARGAVTDARSWLERARDVAPRSSRWRGQLSRTNSA